MHAAVLRYIVEVARQGSIRKAAAALGVASSGINRQLLRLEEELGVRLFDRTPEGVAPTDAGRLLIKHASQTLQGFETLRPLISDVRALRAGHVSVACIDSLNFAVLPEVLRRFLALHPKVIVTIRQAAPDAVIQAVEDGQADIGLTFTRFARQSVRLAGDAPAPFGAVVPNGHPLAAFDSIALESCLAYPMVKHYDPDGRHLFLDEIARREALDIDAAVHTNSMVLAKNVIAQGHAIGIYIRYSLIREIAAREIAFVPLTHPTLAAHRIGIYIPANRNINSIERKLVEIAAGVLAEHG